MPQPFCCHNLSPPLSSVAEASVTFHRSVTLCHVQCRHISVSYQLTANICKSVSAENDVLGLTLINSHPLASFFLD